MGDLSSWLSVGSWALSERAAVLVWGPRPGGLGPVLILPQLLERPDHSQMEVCLTSRPAYISVLTSLLAL